MGKPAERDPEKKKREKKREGRESGGDKVTEDEKKNIKKKKRFHDLLGSWLGWLSRDRSRSSEIAMQNF